MDAVQFLAKLWSCCFEAAGSVKLLFFSYYSYLFLNNFRLCLLLSFCLPSEQLLIMFIYDYLWLSMFRMMSFRYPAGS